MKVELTEVKGNWKQYKRIINYLGVVKMLKEVDRTNKKNSVYLCDRCKKELKVNERIKIAIGIGNNYQKKKWDLCKHCYLVIKKYVLKGVNNNE